MWSYEPQPPKELSTVVLFQEPNVKARVPQPHYGVPIHLVVLGPALGRRAENSNRAGLSGPSPVTSAQQSRTQGLTASSRISFGEEHWADLT
jgi:hypothetical protein